MTPTQAPAQPAVNGPAKETMDTLDYLLQWGLSLWEAMPVGLRAFALTVFAVSLLMEWVKRAVLADKPKVERIRLLWAASLPLGMILAVLGRALTGPVLPMVYWAVIGLTAGTAAMGVHYVTVKMVLPLMGTVYQRLLLMVRGK